MRSTCGFLHKCFHGWETRWPPFQPVITGAVRGPGRGPPPPAATTAADCRCPSAAAPSVDLAEASASVPNKRLCRSLETHAFS